MHIAVIYWRRVLLLSAVLCKCIYENCLKIYHDILRDRSAVSSQRPGSAEGVDTRSYSYRHVVLPINRAVDTLPLA